MAQVTFKLGKKTIEVARWPPEPGIEFVKDIRNLFGSVLGVPAGSVLRLIDRRGRDVSLFQDLGLLEADDPRSACRELRVVICNPSRSTRLFFKDNDHLALTARVTCCAWEEGAEVLLSANILLNTWTVPPRKKDEKDEDSNVWQSCVEVALEPTGYEARDVNPTTEARSVVLTQERGWGVGVHARARTLGPAAAGDFGVDASLSRRRQTQQTLATWATRYRPAVGNVRIATADAAAGPTQSRGHAWKVAVNKDLVQPRKDEQASSTLIKDFTVALKLGPSDELQRSSVGQNFKDVKLAYFVRVRGCQGQTLGGAKDLESLEAKLGVRLAVFINKDGVCFCDVPGDSVGNAIMQEQQRGSLTSLTWSDDGLNTTQSSNSDPEGSKTPDKKDQKASE